MKYLKPKQRLIFSIPVGLLTEDNHLPSVQYVHVSLTERDQLVKKYFDLLPILVVSLLALSP